MSKYTIGQIVKTKKQHVCGSKEWIVLRVGVDMKLECKGCGRQIMMLQFELDKRLIK
ncbi:MAG: DUF951 domain-containing protein [Acholeplasma sp.]